MDDLVDEFARAGHHVSVLAIDTKNPWAKGFQGEISPGVNLFSAGPQRKRSGAVGRLVNHATTLWRLHTAGFSWASKQEFDLVVYTSVGMFTWYFPRRLRASGGTKRSAMVLWDFFPIQHIEIGRIARWVPAGLLKYLERNALIGADAIVVMTPRNVDFLRRYHPGINARISIAAPWSNLDQAGFDQLEVQRYRRTSAEFNLLWAGQMIEGRGLEVLFAALVQLEREHPDLVTTVVGDGPKREAFERSAAELGLKSVRFLGRLPRSDYRALLTDADAGIAITIPNVTIPTFSAKISEFCAYGVPVVVSIEDSSDAGQIVEDAGAGFSSSAGDVGALQDSISRLVNAKRDGTLQDISRSARALYTEKLSVEHATKVIIETAFDGRQAV
ncbi:glycosyltransferase involved in cell wall biosynthesis [Conyzicola nivalis]|uniref:Glycosyltransferase involved in cell wall biosynthesis n=1 Tax=Conyzicola nivalis TaxID=1477021 RepID=A0ABV2QSH8_9MICO